jgi:16S rRNA (guanine966-N2)-methyltransferase
LRIIAGAARGRRLATLPRGEHQLRPTTDRVREALFSILDARVELRGARALDLFAGSGALGCEALSRGADSATFVERSRGAARTIQDNLRRIDRPQEVVLIGECAAILRGLPAERPFDLVLMDPPYQQGHLAATLQLLDQRPLLAPGAIIAAEHHRGELAPEGLDRLQLLTTRAYGDTRISLWTFEPTESHP